jgi:hypothetical protein
MEQVAAHSNHFILDYSQRVKDDWIECIRVNVFHKTLLSDFGVFFGMGVDISESAALCWVDISRNSRV